MKDLKEICKILEEENKSDEEVFLVLKTYLRSCYEEVHDKMTLYDFGDLENLREREEELDQLCISGLIYFSKTEGRRVWFESIREELQRQFVQVGHYIYNQEYQTRKHSVCGSTLNWSWFSPEVQGALKELDRLVAYSAIYLYGDDKKEEIEKRKKKLEELMEWAEEVNPGYLPVIDVVISLVRLEENGKL